jgi:uncharacterized cupin superfamily protein
MRRTRTPEAPGAPRLAARNTETAMTDTPLPPLATFDASVATDTADVPADRVLDGQPRTTVQNHYSDATGRFHCGVWSSTPGRWRVSYTENEFCQLLAGRVRLVGDDGTTREFRPGDTWVIPSGWRGTWETVEAARKYYAIYEPS